MAYKVLIADDQRIVRQMFENVIESAPQYKHIGSVSTPEDAVLFCEKNEVDLVLMDVVMGIVSDGFEAAQRIKQKHPEIKILMVTSMPEVSYIRRAKEIGVDSFWQKEIQEVPLLNIMNRTMAGESVYPSQTPEVWFGNTASTNLTEKELEVLRELVGGASNSEIAEKLGITKRSVQKHITEMLEKTGFRSRLHLALKARAGGLVINDSAVPDQDSGE